MWRRKRGGGYRGKREGGREKLFYVPSGAAVWLMGMGLDGTRVLVSVSVSVLWMVGIGIGVGVVGRCGRGGVGAWFFFFGGVVSIWTELAGVGLVV